MVQTRYGKLNFRSQGSEKVTPKKHCDKVKTVNHMRTAAKQLPLNQSKIVKLFPKRNSKKLHTSLDKKKQDPTLSKPVVQLQFFAMKFRSCQKKTNAPTAVNRWRDQAWLSCCLGPGDTWRMDHPMICS